MKNEKGLTLVELFAAILLVSLIILPTLTALTGNFRANTTQINRSTASTKATQVFQAFDNLYYSDLEDQLDGEDYVLFTINEGCGGLENTPQESNNQIFRYLNNRQVCQEIFQFPVNNFEFTEDNMKVVIFPYTSGPAVRNQDELSDFQQSINDSDLPDDLKNRIIEIEDNEGDPSSINTMRIIVWIEYAPDRSITRVNRITQRFEVRPN